jgi:hypothetical protein
MSVDVNGSKSLWISAILASRCASVERSAAGARAGTAIFTNEATRRIALAMAGAPE